MANAEIIAVTGATGQQGGAVARELSNRGFSVRAITRNPNSPKTEALRKAGADVAVGNFDDPSSLQEAFKGADSVFIVSTPFEAGVEAETQQGIQAVDAAKAAGLKYLVFTSVASADSDTHIPHFDSKFRVEQHIRSVGVPFTIIAPAFFYDNTRSPFLLPGLQKGVFAMGLPAKVKLGCVATESIGSFAAHVFANRDKFLGKRVNIAGDTVTGEEFARILSEASGKEISYVEVPLDQIRAQSEDMATMYDWFNRVGYHIDMEGLRRDYPDVAWPSFKEWASHQDWGLLSS